MFSARSPSGKGNASGVFFDQQDMYTYIVGHAGRSHTYVIYFTANHSPPPSSLQNSFRLTYPRSSLAPPLSGISPPGPAPRTLYVPHTLKKKRIRNVFPPSPPSGGSADISVRQGKRRASLGTWGTMGGILVTGEVMEWGYRDSWWGVWESQSAGVDLKRRLSALTAGPSCFTAGPPPPCFNCFDNLLDRATGIPPPPLKTQKLQHNRSPQKKKI